jgi:hypothetical protein
MIAIYSLITAAAHAGNLVSAAAVPHDPDWFCPDIPIANTVIGAVGSRMEGACTFATDTVHGRWEAHREGIPAYEPRGVVDEPTFLETCQETTSHLVFQEFGVAPGDVGELTAKLVMMETSDEPGQFVIGCKVWARRQIAGAPVDGNNIVMTFDVDGVLQDAHGNWPTMVTDVPAVLGPVTGLRCADPNAIDAGWYVEPTVGVLGTYVGVIRGKFLVPTDVTAKGHGLVEKTCSR